MIALLPALPATASVGSVIVSPFLGPLWGIGLGLLLAGVSYGAFKKTIAGGRFPE